MTLKAALHEPTRNAFDQCCELRDRLIQGRLRLIECGLLRATRWCEYPTAPTPQPGDAERRSLLKGTRATS